METSPDAILISRDLKIVEMNTKALDLFSGYTQEEIIGKSLEELIGPDNLDELRTWEKTIGDGIDVYIHESVLQGLNGPYYVESTSNRIEYDGHSAILTIIKNITKTRKIEEELSDSRDLYRGVIDNAGVGISIWSTDGILLKSNELAKEVMGVSKDEGLSMTDIYGEESGNRYMVRLKEALTSGEMSRSIESIEVNGETRFYMIIIRSINNIHGETIAIQLVSNDITRKKANQEALEHSHHLMEAILENTNEFIMIADKNAKPVMFNAAYAAEMKRMLGTEMKPGINPHTLIGSDEVNAFWENCHRRVLSGETFETEFQFPYGDGNSKFYSVLYHPIIENNEVTGFTEFTRDISEIRSAEQALKKSEEKLRNIIDHSSNVFYTHDYNHVLTYFSPQVRDILGYEPEEAMFEWTKLATDNPVNDEGFKKTVKAIETGEVQTPYELELRRKDGRIIWVEVREAPIVKNGVVEGIVGSLSDITAQKVTQMELQRTMKFADDLINTANIIIVTLSKEGAIRSFNNYAEMISGYSRDEVIGKNWTNLFIPEEYLQEINDVFMGVMSGNENHLAHENPFLTKNGEYVHVSWANTIQRDPSGNVENILSIGVDITERKIALRALEESEERFRSIFEKNPLGISLATLDMRLFHPNEQFCRMLGYTRNEIIGMSIMDKMVKSSWIENNETFSHFLEGMINEFNTVIGVKRKDGKEMTCELTVNKVHDEVGDPAYYIGIIKDITEQRKAQVEMINERKRAEFYLDLLGHDMGNLHQGIYTGLQLARMSSQEDIKEFGLRSTEGLVKRSMKLVKNVLLLSKLSVKDPNLEQIDIGDVLRSSMEHVELLFPKKDVIFETDIQEGKMMIMGEQIIEELFINLLHNGIKFQEGPSSEIELGLKKLDDSVRITVTDKGPGIPHDRRPDLFEKFSPHGKGSQAGIGLSLVSALTERYNGKIEVEDRVQGDHTKGTRFIVTFPLMNDSSHLDPSKSR